LFQLHLSYFVRQNSLDEAETKEIKAENYGLKFQFIKVKGNPSMIYKG
jgi:hypothetical protein